MREIDILKEFSHPNIIKLYEVIDDPNDDKLYLVLEYAARGQIMEFEPRDKRFKPSAEGRPHFSEREVQVYARHLIQALDYIHKHRVLHCDIKPQNVLVDEYGIAKLADFGAASIIGDNDILSGAKGTYEFLAPECCNPEQRFFSGKAADIWALGVTIFCLTFNELPF